eukprot:COSAG04_NODE_2392_length_4215_cov_30.281873_2_plen_985_part_01
MKTGDKTCGLRGGACDRHVRERVWSDSHLAEATAWNHVTFVWSATATDVKVYHSGELRGRCTMEAPIARTLRMSNYIGASPHAPHQNVHGPVMVDEFRLYDRSISALEVAALHSRITDGCCINAGVKSLFGAGDVDLAQYIGAGLSVRMIPTHHETAAEPANPFLPAASDVMDVDELRGTQPHSGRELDICAEPLPVTDCAGSIRDMVGPYEDSMDCGIHLSGYLGSTYSLQFEMLDTEVAGDYVYVFDGSDDKAPLLGKFSGKGTSRIPRLETTGPNMFVKFVSDMWSLLTKDGFFARFQCTGDPTLYWQPGDVAVTLPVGADSMEQSIVQATACLSNVLLSVQCCADAEQSCRSSRATELDLSNQQLRGYVPMEIGNLKALRALKLHSNFLEGTLPEALGSLYWLRELQLDHNRFLMQERRSLAKVLAGMPGLQTMDMGMSSDTEDLSRCVITPSPPLQCRVARACSLILSTRTAHGANLPHGGLRVEVSRLDAMRTSSLGSSPCLDLMDGTYTCDFPTAWISKSGSFAFELTADGTEIEPMRTVANPTTGASYSISTYSWLGVRVEPITCTDPHSHPNDDGSRCSCEDGYYRHEYGGGWSCDQCDRGQMPVDGNTRCQSCGFGFFSSTGRECIRCPPGSNPNLATGADDCVPCDSTAISPDGAQCGPCPPDQIADESHTRCICPAGTYNSSVFSGNAVQCVVQSIPANVVRVESVCASCDGLDCVTCGQDRLPTINTGWSRSSFDDVATKTPWFVFQCPLAAACENAGDTTCRVGHTGALCNVCADGYGMIGKACDKCTAANSTPWIVIIGAFLVALVGGLRAWHRRQPSVSLSAQTDNPLHSQNSSMQKRGSMRVAAERSSDALMLFRVVYQPLRILVGYVQVVSQIGLVLKLDFPPYVRQMFIWLKPFAVDIKSLFQLECLSDLKFYHEWVLRVFIIPLILVGIAGSHYAYMQRKSGSSGVDAAASLRSHLFVILFVVYP